MNNNMTETNTFRIETNGTKFRVARLYMPHRPGQIVPLKSAPNWLLKALCPAYRRAEIPPPPTLAEWRPVRDPATPIDICCSFMGKPQPPTSFKTEKQARAFIRRMYGEMAKIEEPTWRPL